MDKMKKIMILGGSENQLAFIKKAKEIGLYTIVCDYAENCIGFKYADKCCLVSIKDEAALLDIARKEQVCGIATNSEQVLHIATSICEKLDLPTVPYEIMDRFRDKEKMRECLTPLGLSDVAFKLCFTQEEAINFFRENQGRKCIMKPLDNSSSRGVFSVLSESDIEQHFSESIGSNRTHSGVLMETYIDGTEFTVDGICVNGKHSTLAISRKRHFAYNENIANELYFSYIDPDFDYDVLRSLNNRIVEAAGLNFGLTHAEYKYSDGQFHLIEVAARGGGAFISTDIVPFLTKTDTIKAFLNAACGMEEDQVIRIPEDSKERVAVLRFFSTPGDESGTVKDILGLDFLKSNPNIFKYGLEFKIGDYIHPALNDGERVGYYIAFEESRQRLNELMKQVDENFQIIF